MGEGAGGGGGSVATLHKKRGARPFHLLHVPVLGGICGGIIN